MKLRSIDLNCDMGESFGAWRMGQDETIMPWITSANIACGAHAGDPDVMARTVGLAKEHGVAVGAHPGYPDLQGFGRRRLSMRPDEVTNYVLAQIGALWAIARSEGVALHHVKPHGALYNSAASDAGLAWAIVSAIRIFSPGLVLYCLPGSEMEKAAYEQGISVAREGFADRAYEPNGLLVDRSLRGAVLRVPESAAAHALALAAGKVVARDGTELALSIDTICVHGDTPGAAQIARCINTELASAGYTLAPARRGFE